MHKRTMPKRTMSERTWPDYPPLGYAVVDPGHVYDVYSIGNMEPPQRIHFTKREGENYPGNEGILDGPITQNFLRAILHRMHYMNAQGPCAETDMIIAGLQTAIMGFEVRAARCRGSSIVLPSLSGIEREETCPTCGHVQCDQTRHDRPHWSEENPITKHGVASDA